MKSSIDHAGEPAQPWVPGNREFSAGRAARREREALWAREVFTLISAASVLREILALLYREGPCQWAGGQVRQYHPRKEVCRPRPRGRRIWGQLAGTKCPLLPPCQSLLPLTPRAFSVPRFPQKPQLQEETLPGPGGEAAASRGSLLREKQGPYP